MSGAYLRLALRRYTRPLLAYTRDLYLWEFRRGIIPPQFIKRKVVQQYQQRYGLAVFCETGTYLGEMLRGVRETFRDIYSIELDSELFAYAKLQFRRYPHIHLHHGDSGTVLQQIMTRISDPCLFWLDAHFSHGITAKGELETPIVRELLTIKNHYIPGSIILIDDARHFTGQDDYPSQTHVAALLHSIDPGFEVNIEHDIICAHNPQFAQCA